MSKRKVKKKIIQIIAQERIDELFKLADDQLHLHHDKIKANRYAHLARRISMKSNVKIPKKYKRRVCPSCKSYMLPGFNCRVRVRTNRNPHVVQTCLDCNQKKRYLIKKRNKDDEHKKS